MQIQAELGSLLVAAITGAAAVVSLTVTITYKLFRAELIEFRDQLDKRYVRRPDAAEAEV